MLCTMCMHGVNVKLLWKCVCGNNCRHIGKCPTCGAKRSDSGVVVYNKKVEGMFYSACEFVVEKLKCYGSLPATVLIRQGSGVVYPEKHPTLWRRVDRGIQKLRKQGIIKYKDKKWHLVRKHK